MSRTRTRLSLFYVAFYLTNAGLGLTFAPELSLRMLQSNAHYDATAMRFAGLFIVGLAMIVIQIIRLRLDALYSTLIVVRIVFCTAYVVLYVQHGDPFFLVTLAIVGLGLVASSVSYVLDSRDRGARAGAPG
jgi:uncharacterized protein YjeT (DUF2065 family)